MARFGRASGPKQDGSTQVQFSEVIIFIAIAAAIIAGIRYYFVVYRNSAGYTLGIFLNAVNHGDVDAQYAMLDASDKNSYFPTVKDYENSSTAPLAHGYTERLTGWQITSSTGDETKAKVSVSIDIRGLATGKELYQTGGSNTVKDSYVLRKDGSNQWRVVLHESALKLFKIKPNDKSSFY